MFRILFPRHTVSILLLVLLIVSSACNASSGGAPTPQSSPDSGQQQITIERDTDYGPGPFDLPDTRVGLSDLSSYTVSLVMTFEGIRDGSAEKWSKAYTMLAINSPQARQWTIEKSGNASSPTSVFMAETGGLDYERRGEEACIANVIEEGNTLRDRLDLASFLSPIIGAEEAGSETVNGLEAKHYTFDQRALGEDGITESTGELWIASEGNYIVKYLLTRKGKADYFGEGIEGTLNVDYELTGPNQPVTIALPDDCPPGMVDAPLLPDASNVDKSPGRLSYETASSLKDAVDFYQKNLPGLGWEAATEPAVSDAAAVLMYKKGNESLNLFLTSKDGKVTVEIALGTASN